jgi:hypothetical protein
MGRFYSQDGMYVCERQEPKQTILKKIMTANPVLILNIDFYINSDGNLVFTEKYHLDRGHCCQSGCLHCPYGYNQKTDPNVPAEFNDAWGSDDNAEDEAELLQEDDED